MSIRVSIVPHIPLSLGHGGLEVQQEHTMMALRDAGVDVQQFDPWNTTFDADVLHVFGSFYHQAETVARAVAKNIPVVVTSMFVRTKSPLTYSIAKYVDTLGFRTLYGVRRELLRSATRVLALSDAEKTDLVKIFGVADSKIDVIGNGVEERFFSATPDLFRSVYGADEFVLCVASVEPNKNQLALIDALGPTGIPLVMIGAPKLYATPEVTDYIDSVHTRCNTWKSIRWIQGLDHTDPLLASAFAAARVHVLPSFAEGQGISSLEAAATGASLAMSNLSTLRSVYGEDATYFDPRTVGSIRTALLHVWSVSRGNKYEQYPNRTPPWLVSWADVAQSLVRSYRACLDIVMK